MPCLDTNILVGLLRGDTDAISKIRSFEDRRIKFSTTSINACEIFNGAFRSSRQKENRDIVNNMFENMAILNFDLESSRIAGRLINGLKNSGESISEMDVMIAAIVIANNEILVTRDLEHFMRIKELRVEAW